MAAETLKYQMNSCYSPVIFDRTKRIRRLVDLICKECSHMDRHEVETMIFEAGLPIVLANLKAVAK